MAHDVVVNRSMGFRVAIDYCRRNGAFVRPRVGTDEMWDHAERVMATVLAQIEAQGHNHRIKTSINPGEGAFYGPKLEFVLRDATILGVRGAAVDAHVAVVAAEWQRPQHGGDGEHGLRPRGRRAGQRARGPALRIRDRRPREHKEQHRHDRLLAGTPHQDASTTEQRYTEHHDGAR